jgi:hypothetical protein
MPADLVDPTDPSSAQEDGHSLATLGQEGLTEGFIDDIQGLLDGR